MKRLLSLLVFVSTLLLGHAQVVRIQFEQCDRSMERAISKAVSIDRRDGCTYTAYANPNELAALEALGIDYQLAPLPVDLTKTTLTAATTVEQMDGWNMYPSYSVYLQLMQNWADNYPNICKLDTIGYSYNNHLILCLKISDNPTETEAEPEWFYMSSMHGDEVTGYYFMLRMIDTLLSSYGTVDDLTELVNSTQIYICPDANPDGTYKGGDNYIWQPNNTYDYSGRYNGNGVDLNRTYPDPFNTTSTYEEQYEATEIENKYMIQYLDAHHFVMAACMHGGSEILNFPWDSYTSSQKSLADAAWWTAMGNRFLTTLRTYTGTANRYNFPNNMYYSERINGSYTGQCFGGDWYAISGGWQDFSNWYKHTRAFTIEVSNTKCPTVSGTQGTKAYWNYQRQSLIDLLKEVHQGVHGFVVDSVTRQPLHAFIEVVDHDRDSSQIYSRPILGDYYRPIADGTYAFRASCPGYITKTYSNVTASYGSPTDLLIELVPEGWIPVTYTITATSEDNTKGTVTGGGNYLGGQTATITATANAGYQFDHWNDGNTDNPRSFTVTGDATYTAYFTSETFTLTVASEDIAKGTAYGSGSYPYGTTIQISATPADHYTFAHWDDNNTDNPRTVTVTEDKTYTAFFDAERYTITVASSNNNHGTAYGSGVYDYGTTATITAEAASGYRFVQWNDGNTDNPRTITVTGNATYTAQFATETYTLTVTAEDHGTAYGSGTYDYGVTATLTAEADEGYHFTQWDDGNTDNPRYVTVTANASYNALFAINSYSITIQPNNPDYGTTTGSNTYTHGQSVTASANANEGYYFDSWSDGSTQNPYIFSATRNLTLTANFVAESYEPVYYTVTVLSDNDALGTAMGTGTYLEGSVVRISATALYGHHFTQWNDASTDNPRYITVTGDATYTAYFAPDSYTVTVSPDDASHGSTTPNGSASYSYGQTLTLTASAAEGYHFQSWNDGNVQPSRTVTVNGNASYVAYFAPNSYRITVSANNPSYGNTFGTGTYSYGQQVPISAEPVEGHTFSQWSDGSTEASRTITVTSDATYTAIFTVNNCLLTVMPDDASHGSTTPNGTANYAYGEHVGISATPAEGYRFRQWSDGNSYPIRTVVVTGNQSYTAYFDAIEYTVTVQPNNTICGSTTGSGTYSYMDEVTATATPAEGFRFDHWSNGVTDNPYSFNVSHNTTLIAIFVSDGSNNNGIDDVETASFSIYPNPTTGIINLRTHDETAGIRIYNLYGQLMQEVPVGTETIDISDYPHGTYIMRIGAHSKKIVKL